MPTTSPADRGKMIHTLKEPMLSGRSTPTTLVRVLPTSDGGSIAEIPVEITLTTLLLFEQSPPTPAGSSFHCLKVSKSESRLQTLAPLIWIGAASLRSKLISPLGSDSALNHARSNTAGAGSRATLTSRVGGENVC